MEDLKPSLFKDFRATIERIEKFYSKHEFTDCNLYGARYPDSIPVSEIRHIDFGKNRKTSFPDAQKALNEVGGEVSVGFKIGPTWSTHWFKLSGTLPEKWIGKQVNTLYFFL